MATYEEPKYLMQILTDAFMNKNNDVHFNRHEVLTEYKVAKNKYYSTKEANELKIKKRKKHSIKLEN